MANSPSKLTLRLRALALLGSLALLLYFTGWLLLNPGNVVNRSFRNPVAALDGKVLTGPYPTEADLGELRQHGVTTIVSLLDARVPYEDVLLAREREAATRAGFRFLNFPMTSFFGHQLGDDYELNASGAANAIARLQDRVYLHCYLGVHRVAAVRALLERGRTESVGALPHQEDHLTREGRVQRVSLRFEAGDFDGALQSYAAIEQPEPGTQLMAAWANLRLNRIDAAESLFRAVGDRAPDLWDARSGLAYCALRRNQLTEAEGRFRSVLERHADDEQAEVGLAITEARSGHYADAISLLGHVLAAHPENAEARELKATYGPRAVSSR